MATEKPGNMADERRGLLTDREREILRTNGADVSDKYYGVVVSRARNKIEQVAGDLAALENHPTLADELREIVESNGDTDMESDTDTESDTDSGGSWMA